MLIFAVHWKDGSSHCAQYFETMEQAKQYKKYLLSKGIDAWIIETPVRGDEFLKGL